MSPTTPLLDARGITKRFAGICALDHVDLHLDAHELVGLIGPNGAGKTTLFNCLYGILTPDEGTVALDGTVIDAWSVRRRAQAGFGRTFQRPELFASMSVADHLLVADRAHRGGGGVLRDLVGRGRVRADERHRIGEVLDQLGLGDVADEPIESLSLGRVRLVELGRALMTEPRLLFLDEPFSGLDRTETDEVSATLLATHAARPLTVLLVEHDVTAVEQICERLVVLDYGSRIASGPTAEVLADPRVREAYLGVAR